MPDTLPPCVGSQLLVQSQHCHAYDEIQPESKAQQLWKIDDQTDLIPLLQTYPNTSIINYSLYADYNLRALSVP